MKLKDWIWDSALHLSDTSFNKVCDGYADGLHVIGTCEMCEYTVKFSETGDDVCQNKQSERFSKPSIHGCIHWEKKK